MKKFFQNEEGTTAIEYGLITAAIALALLAVGPSLTEWLLSFGS